MDKLIAGKWYPKDSSKQYSAQLVIKGANYTLHILPDTTNKVNATNDATLDDTSPLTGSWSDVSINERLGNTERKLTLADGSLFTTFANDAIDALIKNNKNSDTTSKWSLSLHRHETKLTSVLMMLVLTIVFVFSFVKWGLPWTSQAIAHALPQKTGELIGKQSLKVMDKYFLQPSTLSEAEQQQITTRFATRLEPFDGKDDIHYQLHFRDMKMGDISLPNAFALPSGDIILTDKFVQLSKNDDEIDAVLLHEMGHVVHRHGLEMLTQNSLTTMIVMLVLGNPDGVSELATGLGTSLLANHYSRQHETEADEYAFKKMLEIGINPQAFVDILSRMEDYANNNMLGSDNTHAEHEHNDERETAEDELEQGTLSDFLSTHPNTQLRIKMANKYSGCYERGLTVCD